MSDEDDLRLFESSKDPELARKIICIKNNDTEARSLYMYDVDDLSKCAWRRLGCILRQSTTVETLHFDACDMDVAGLFGEFQHSRWLKRIVFSGMPPQGMGKLSILVPHVSHPSRAVIRLFNCNLGPAVIDILSTVLLNCSEDTLQTLDLSFNNFGDDDLANIVLLAQNLSRKAHLHVLLLGHNRIRTRGCISLAELLRNEKSNLQNLHLHGNPINNESTAILADALADNTKLKGLNLGKSEEITSVGLLALLKLVCNCFNSSIDDVMNSNHTLCDIGMSLSDLTPTLGADDASLLHAALRINTKGGKMLRMRHKMIWSHARGSLNLGDSSIAAGSIPLIMGWIGCYNEASLVQYHCPPLPEERLNVIKLDGLYRIVRCRPYMCDATSG